MKQIPRKSATFWRPTHCPACGTPITKTAILLQALVGGPKSTRELATLLGTTPTAVAKTSWSLQQVGLVKTTRVFRGRLRVFHELVEEGEEQ